MHKEEFPEGFIDRLKKIIPGDCFEQVLGSMSFSRPTAVRLNTLKTTKDSIIKELKEGGAGFKPVDWYEQALIVEDKSSIPPALLKEGFLYPQSLSSQLVVLALDPKPGEDVLDMCAAPGSKTTQIAQSMNNQGSIVAVEAIKGRFFKLKSVIRLLGATNVSVKLCDARRYRGGDQLFDRVLVDAPCSSEGRFNVLNPKTFGFWSVRKIKEMVKKQRGILLSSSRFLKPGGTLVYSTCTFAPEENEGVVDWFLKKAEGIDIVSSFEGEAPVAGYAPVSTWQGKEYNPAVSKCLRIMPSEIMDGFFVAKFVKGVE